MYKVKYICAVVDTHGERTKCIVNYVDNNAKCLCKSKTHAFLTFEIKDYKVNVKKLGRKKFMIWTLNFNHSIKSSWFEIHSKIFHEIYLKIIHLNIFHNIFKIHSKIVNDS